VAVLSDQSFAADIPAGFHQASRIVRSALQQYEAAGYSDEAIATAMLTEVMPRIVGAHGPTAVAIILRYVQGKLGIVEEPVIGFN